MGVMSDYFGFSIGFAKTVVEENRNTYRRSYGMDTLSLIKTRILQVLE